MEPEETGLTVAEKIMFLILGLALVVVGGILIFGKAKDKNQSLQETNQATEKANNDEVKNETVSDDSEKTTEEPKENESKENELEIKNGETSESESQTNENNGSSNEQSEDISDTSESKEEISNDSKETEKNSTNENSTNENATKENSTNDDTPYTRVPDTRIDDNGDNASWELPKNIILEAYVGDTIEVNKTVVNQNGQSESAQVTIRRLEGNSYNIVELTNNRFVASKGTYKYYYTHNSITKVATLHVDEKASNVSFTPLKSFDYIENDEFTKFEMTNMIENSKETTITKDNDVYVINIKKTNESNYSALLINTGEEIHNIKSNTKGIYIGSDYSTLWNDYTSGTARVLVNLNYINNNEVIKLRMTINGETKIIEVKFVITNKEEEREKLESDQNNIINSDIESEKEESKEEIIDESNSSNKEELPTMPTENNIEEVDESNNLNQSLDRT